MFSKKTLSAFFFVSTLFALTVEFTDSMAIRLNTTDSLRCYCCCPPCPCDRPLPISDIFRRRDSH